MFVESNFLGSFLPDLLLFNILNDKIELDKRETGCIKPVFQFLLLDNI